MWFVLQSHHFLILIEIFFLATKKEQPVRFQGLSKVINQILGNWKTTLATFFTHQPSTGSIKYMYRLKSHVFERLNFFYFKVNVIKRQLNFVSPKFGLKSYLWFQIWALDLKSRIIHALFRPNCTPLSITYHSNLGSKIITLTLAVIRLLKSEV